MDIRRSLNRWLNAKKESGLLHVAFALLTEALLIGYIAFISLFAIETLLPTFITARLSLTKFFFFLVIFTFLAAFLAHSLKLRFAGIASWKHPLVIIGSIGAIATVALSLYKFPLAAIILILVGFSVTGFLFSRILFTSENAE